LIGTAEGAAEFNEGIRESGERAANVDKGFMHYLKYYRNNLEVTASIRIESGRHGEYGWGVYFDPTHVHAVRRDPTSLTEPLGAYPAGPSRVNVFH
jgi:hypothetical protein